MCGTLLLTEMGMPAQHVSCRSSMNEWCAYGMEVPLQVPDCDVPEVVQCYVPYLSAMQLRRAPAPPNAATRAAAALVHFCASDSDCASISDLSASSDRALDSDSDDAAPAVHAPSSTPSRRRGRVIFEYSETRPPHMREPLTDCIDMLAATRCPELNTLRSCDLDPSSWFSIAWYPLYRLQATGQTIRDLNACFLTYHQLGDAVTMPPSLSSLSPAAAAALQRREGAVLAEGVGIAAAVLAPCAMVPYKLAGRTWDDTYRSRKLQLQLLRASNELVTCSGLHHGDFAFFWGTLRRR